MNPQFNTLLKSKKKISLSLVTMENDIHSVVMKENIKVSGNNKLMLVARGIKCISSQSKNDDTSSSPSYCHHVSRLYLSKNHLQSLSKIHIHFPYLQVLSLSHNNLCNNLFSNVLPSLSPLSKSLRILYLTSNPICNYPFYRSHVISVLPLLTNLDSNVRITNEERRNVVTKITYDKQSFKRVVNNHVMIHKLQRIALVVKLHKELRSHPYFYHTLSTINNDTMNIDLYLRLYDIRSNQQLVAAGGGGDSEFIEDNNVIIRLRRMVIGAAATAVSKKPNDTMVWEEAYTNVISLQQKTVDKLYGLVTQLKDYEYNYKTLPPQQKEPEEEDRKRRFTITRKQRLAKSLSPTRKRQSSTTTLLSSRIELLEIKAKEDRETAQSRIAELEQRLKYKETTADPYPTVVRQPSSVVGLVSDTPTISTTVASVVPSSNAIVKGEETTLPQGSVVKSEPDNNTKVRIKVPDDDTTVPETVKTSLGKDTKVVPEKELKVNRHPFFRKVLVAWKNIAKRVKRCREYKVIVNQMTLKRSTRNKKIVIKYFVSNTQQRRKQKYQLSQVLQLLDTKYKTMRCISCLYQWKHHYVTTERYYESLVQTFRNKRLQHIKLKLLLSWKARIKRRDNNNIMISSLQCEKEKLEKKLSQTTLELKSLSSNFTTNAGMYKESVTSYEDQVSSLKEEIRNLKNEKSNAEFIRVQLEARVEGMENELQNLQRNSSIHFDTMSEQVDTLVREKTDLTALYKHAVVERDDVTMKLRRVERELEGAKYEIELKNDRLSLRASCLISEIKQSVSKASTTNTTNNSSNANIEIQKLQQMLKKGSCPELELESTSSSNTSTSLHKDIKALQNKLLSRF